MYTRTAPGEMYTKAVLPRSGRDVVRAPPLVPAPATGAGGLSELEQQGSSLLSLAGRAELKLCIWMALAYFFMFTACKQTATLDSHANV